MLTIIGKSMVEEEKTKENINRVYSIVDDDAVVSQILSRLPAKSLMRFKCVCKSWKSIIEHDTHFVDLHHTHSQARPVLLIATEGYQGLNSKWHTCFFTADLQYDDDDGDNVIQANLRTLRRLNTPDRVQEQLGPIRGLICLVGRYLAVQIYNVSTGQVVTPWIQSPEVTKRKTYPCGICFGFDPGTGKHKVVHVWESLNQYEAPICEVLTVGDTRWRIIDDRRPPCQILGDTSVYANGSVYWIANNGSDLLAFDVGPEKFRMIPIPEFICTEYRLLYMKLMEMDGFPTVVCRTHARDPVVTMWKFHGTEEEEEHWSEVNIRLPSYIDVCYIYFHPIAGKDEMIVETYSPPDADNRFRRNVNLARFYSCNLKKKTLSNFEIQGISSVPDNYWTSCSTLVESL